MGPFLQLGRAGWSLKWSRHNVHKNSEKPHRYPRLGCREMHVLWYLQEKKQDEIVLIKQEANAKEGRVEIARRAAAGQKSCSGHRFGAALWCSQRLPFIFSLTMSRETCLPLAYRCGSRKLKRHARRLRNANILLSSSSRLSLRPHFCVYSSITDNAAAALEFTKCPSL